MSADRYMPSHRFSPSAALLSGGIAAGMFAALVLLAPKVVRSQDGAITLIPIAAPTPPPPQPKPIPRATKPSETPTSHVTAPLPEVPTDTTPAVTGADPAPIPPLDLSPAPTIAAIPEPARPMPPAIVDPSVDPRYAAQFQPPYPPEETNAGREGMVVLRVLIGIDGRVHQIERVSASSDAFWRVTQRRALTAWHFRPGTRDGVPEERWRVVRVRFELNQAE